MAEVVAFDSLGTVFDLGLLRPGAPELRAHDLVEAARIAIRP